MRYIILTTVLCRIDMYRYVSLRCTIHVVTTKDFIYDTALGTLCNILVQFHSSIATDVSSNSIIAGCTLTSAVGIVSDGTACQVNHSTLFNLAHLAAAINIVGNDAAFDVHFSPKRSSVCCRIVLAITCTYTRERMILTCEHNTTRTTAGTIDATTNRTALDVHLIVRIGCMIARCFFLLIFRLTYLWRTNRGHCTATIDITFNYCISVNINLCRTGHRAGCVVAILIITIRVSSDT